MASASSPQKKQPFDSEKYELAEDMPAKFAIVIPGLGVQHFEKDRLTNNDLKALTLAKSRFVKDKTAPAQAEYKEDRPALKDIDKGKFPT